MDKNLSDNSAPIMSEDNAQNHANFADAFSMTAKAIKIDKRLPSFFGGWAGNIQLNWSKITSLAGLRALKPDFNRSAAIPHFFGPLRCPRLNDFMWVNT
ncbi:hypothetical protein D1BOALGB6SA_8231 [Olavius sp. associated proteobacterium Delta 1]|nr:hypothetical protein D1BOALGB6SA_8231 [Olavius sp. associated proteobacterium Delta 1]